MKEKLDGELTPLQMLERDRGRLSENDAHDLANLMITKFDGLDLTKLEPKDYEEAEKEILELKRWAEGKETTEDTLVAILKRMTVLMPLLFISTLGINAIADINPNAGNLILSIFGSMSLSALSLGRKYGNVEKKLSELETNNRKRIIAEEEY